MPASEFEPEIPARELPQTHALDLATTGISILSNISASIINPFLLFINTSGLVSHVQHLPKESSRSSIEFLK